MREALKLEGVLSVQRDAVEAHYTVMKSDAVSRGRAAVQTERRTDRVLNRSIRAFLLC